MSRRRRLVTLEKLEEAFKLLDSGETFRKVAAKLGIPKSTLHYYYKQYLEEKVEELKKKRAELEQEILELENKKTGLEGESEKLKRETESIKAAFKAQGLSWEEGVALLKQIRDLRKERDRLEKEIEEKAKEVQRLARDCLYFRKQLDELKRVYLHWYP